MSRIAILENMYYSFKETGIYLLTKCSLGYSISTSADDMGYFFYSIILGSSLGLSCIKATYCFFNISIGVLFSIIGISCFYMGKSYSGYGIIVIGLLRLWMPFIYLNHPYIAYGLGVAPIAILLCADFRSSKILFWISSLSGGIIASITNTIRMFSALPMFVFYIIYILFSYRQSVRQKSIFIFLFLIGYSIPYFHYMYHMNKRDTFLVAHGIAIPERTTHVFWHNIYTGLGFLSNQESIAWQDKCAGDRALIINPKARYPSVLYEKTIRNEIFRLCREKRYFIATTIFAKLGVILYFFLIYFGGLGILVSWFYPKPWYLELALWAALGISALPGILTLPTTPYLIGFITVTIIYTMYSLIIALNRGILKDFKKYYVTKIRRHKSGF
ncbi:MAG: hypothetical protein ACJAZS_000165 [Alteromonas naphthalenivorans]|jgi:hypothetical protein